MFARTHTTKPRNMIRREQARRAKLNNQVLDRPLFPKPIGEGWRVIRPIFDLGPPKEPDRNLPERVRRGLKRSQ